MKCPIMTDHDYNYIPMYKFSLVQIIIDKAFTVFRSLISNL
jgi:hypothetical protein